jgi:sugar lactone lactonase YvrE
MPGVGAFRLRHDQITPIGRGLSRPECVLTTKWKDLYASDSRGGVSHLLPDGSITHYYGKSISGDLLGANGFALLEDGSFLIAPLSGGGVHRLYRDGHAEVFLDKVGDRPVETPNFVLLDNLGRIWVCVLGIGPRRSVKSFSRHSRDGFIILIDEDGARVVAEGIGLPNEVRVDATGRYLYVVETLAARLLRFKIGRGGDLGQAELVCELDDSNMFDGFALDSEGGAWITALISNRLWYVDPIGRPSLIIEDSQPSHIAQLRAHQRSVDGVPKDFIYIERNSTLRNISSVAFGSDDLSTVYMGSLMGESLYSFRSPVPGFKPAHWEFGPF